jgi:hypothetical protein
MLTEGQQMYLMVDHGTYALLRSIPALTFAEFTVLEPHPMLIDRLGAH